MGYKLETDLQTEPKSIRRTLISKRDEAPALHVLDVVDALAVAPPCPSHKGGSLTWHRPVTNDRQSQCDVSFISVIGSEARVLGAKQRSKAD